MSIAVTRTKIRVPRRRADLLSRPRLNSSLLDILDYPFTLISAPAGYGKTSLMIDLAHQASHPACWYSIDSLDKDPKRFLAHLIHAIKVEFPEFGKPSLDLLDSLADPLSSPDQFVSTLINDIYNLITENFVIFLDDFHLLDNTPQINRFVSCFGQQMDENTHLVMSSRELFNFPDLPLLIGRKQVKGVDQEDLAFQPQELREYFQEKLHQPLTEEASRNMVSGSAGWITGLLLSKDNLDSLLPDQHKAAKVSGADLDSYFTDQVFLKQTSSVRKLMLKTSLFDEFNAAFCSLVLGEPENISWSEFLNALTEHNLFIEQVEDNGIWFRYHHLFRDYLRQELENQLPGKKQQILYRLIEVHLDAQDWEKAFDAARQLADPRRMAEVVDTAFSSLFHSGRIKLLADWLEILPNEGFRIYPILILIKGITFTSLGDPQKGLTILSNALKNEKVLKNREMYCRGLLCKATTHRLMGNYVKALSFTETILEEPNKESDKFNIIAEAQREAALCKYHLGKYKEALLDFDSSLKSYNQAKDNKNSSLVHSDLGCILMSHGQFSQAKSHFHKAQNINLKLENYSQLSNILNNLATLNILTGKYEEAYSLLLQAEDYSIKTNNTRIQSFILGSKGDLALSILQFKIAYEEYQKAENIANIVKEGYLLSYLPISKAICLRNLDKLALAEKILGELEEKVIQGSSQYELGLWDLEWGYVHLSQSDLETAQEAFQSAKAIFSEVNRPYEQAKACLGLCLAYNAEKQQVLLKRCLRELENLLPALETLQPLLPEFSRYRKSIQQMVDSQPGIENLSSCLDEIDLYLQRLPKLQETLYPRSAAFPETPELRIQAFGDIRVSQGGNRITSSEWIHQKTVREIFFYILSQPRGVTKEQVGVAFWPDSSPSQLSCQFKNAIYRLRRALGKETILFHQDTHSYSFNREIRYYFDVEEFQDACKMAENQPKEDKRIEDLRRAASMYKHPFAPQLGGIWAEPLRRKLHLDYEKAQLEIAAYDLKLKNYPACRDTCLAILEIEPCQEKAYQLCMEAYYYLEDIMNVRRTYEKCITNLLTSLNIEPTNNTKSLYERLINS